MRLSRPLLLTAAAVAALFLFAAPAWAAAANFASATGSVNSAGALVVAFDERGLGNGDIDYMLQANAQAVYACINGGGNRPASKETVNSEVSTGGSFASKNGRVVASVSAGPPPAGAFNCPSGQRLVLISVSYTDILLNDTTNGASAFPPPVSRTLITP